MKRFNTYILLLLMTFLNNKYLISQEIDFGSYSSQYSVILSEVNPGSALDFGIIIDQAGETTAIDIQDSKVFSIEGVEYLDVFVEIIADSHLLLDDDPNNQNDPTRRLPLNLRAAYANLGQDNTGHAINFLVVGSTANALFPIRNKGGNTPPGPPPTPVFEGYNPSLYNDTAYLYIYPTVTTTGNLVSGSYMGTINISVSYD